MAKFVFNKPKPRFVIPAKSKMINGQMIEVAPSRKIDTANYELDTKEFVKKHTSFTEEEVAGRIRSDSKFGTAEIREITAADEKVIAIKTRKLKEAEEEIKKLKEEGIK